MASYHTLNELHHIFNFDIKDNLFIYRRKHSIDEFNMLIDAVARDPNINGIDIGSISISNTELDILTNMLKQNKNITSLSVHNINGGNGFMLSHEFLSFFDMLSHNNNITKFEYYNGTFHNRTKYFGELLEKNTSLTSLNLQNNNITNDDMKILSNGLSKNRTLTSIDISKNKFDDIGLEYLLGALKHNYSLIFIEFSNTVDVIDDHYFMNEIDYYYNTKLIVDAIYKELENNKNYKDKLMYKIFKNI